MYMQVLLVCAIAMLGAQGAISSERIETDAAKWADLQRDYINRAPSLPLRGRMRATCRMLRECCPEERSRFFDLTYKRQFENVCLKERVSKSFGRSMSLTSTQSPKCKQSAQQLEEIRSSPDYKRFMSAMTGIKGSDERIKNWRMKMVQVCSPAELDAYYCDPDNFDLFQSCQEKVLRSVARESNERDYETYVRDLKSHYNTYNQKLSNAFRYCS